MDANLVNLLMWTKPIKSAATLISINIILWFLIRQRPLCVLPLVLLCYYLRYLWKHRIRPEVLVDPPDHESWTTLSTYDLEHVTCNFGKSIWNSWTSLRQENHTMWALGTGVLWVIMAKIGSQLDFLTFLFVISNALFVVGPLMKCLPKDIFITNDSEDSRVQDNELNDLMPDLSAADSSSKRSMPKAKNGDSEVKQEPEPSSEPKANFATSLLSRLSPSKMTSSDSKESSPQPESLSPSSALPDFDQDSDPDDEFLFDTKHFESSSSSTSNSFELIHF